MFQVNNQTSNSSDNTDSKKKIVDLFNQNVRGKKPDTHLSNAKHAGKEGHWLESQMGIAHNADNLPDIFGYEMKNNTSLKTTFGDWSADYYIYNDKNFRMTRDDFIRFFGKSNLKKGGRFSWSGEPCPKLNSYSHFGQIMTIDENKNIVVKYSFSKDMRPDKQDLVPLMFQKEDLLIVRWDGLSLKKKVEKKFNNLGWFKCLKDEVGCYTKIVFGDPINFDNWIAGVEKGLIFFDSGMYQGNKRNYSQWRASNHYWDSLITDSF